VVGDASTAGVTQRHQIVAGSRSLSRRPPTGGSARNREGHGPSSVPEHGVRLISHQPVPHRVPRPCVPRSRPLPVAALDAPDPISCGNLSCSSCGRNRLNDPGTGARVVQNRDVAPGQTWKLPPSLKAVATLPLPCCWELWSEARFDDSFKSEPADALAAGRGGVAAAALE